MNILPTSNSWQIKAFIIAVVVWDSHNSRVSFTWTIHATVLPGIVQLGRFVKCFPRINLSNFITTP